MSDNMFCTEQEVKQLIFDTSATVDVKPVVFVAKRVTLKENKLAYTATFAVQTNTDNEALIVAIMKMSLEYQHLNLQGSDVDIQGNNLMVDFLWVEAIIQPRLT